MFVTNWISTTKIQKISEITNFFRHYFLSRTEVYLSYEFEPKLFWSSTGCKKQTMQNKMEVIFVSRQLTFLFFLHFILNNLIFYNFYASL